MQAICNYQQIEKCIRYDVLQTNKHPDISPLMSLNWGSLRLALITITIKFTYYPMSGICYIMYMYINLFNSLFHIAINVIIFIIIKMLCYL